MPIFHKIPIKLNQLISDLYSKYLDSSGVCTDTRTLKSGQIFFALKGPSFNGNTYAELALARGARYVVIDEPVFDQGEKCLLVENVLTVLQALATHHRQHFDIPVFGITGSNGKTTTKELVARVMQQKYQVHYTQGNLNNHIGVPLTLLSMPLTTEFAIIEMGANHLGDIAELCEIAQPTHGLITNIGNAHLGEFGGIENLIRAKSELFDYLRKNDGQVFINSEDRVLCNMSKRFEHAIQYPDANCTLLRAKPYVHYMDRHGQEHATEMIGAYNFLNISAAIAVGNFFSVENPYDAVDRYVPGNNRSQVLELASNKVILDAYNANPASMEGALHNLAIMTGETKIALLGEMKELGKYAEDEHRKIVVLSSQLGMRCLWVGKHFAQVVENQDDCFDTVDELIVHLRLNPLSGSIVLVKGSRSTQMEKLIQAQAIWI